MIRRDCGLSKRLIHERMIEFLFGDFAQPTVAKLTLEVAAEGDQFPVATIPKENLKSIQEVTYEKSENHGMASLSASISLFVEHTGVSQQDLSGDRYRKQGTKG